MGSLENDEKLLRRIPLEAITARTLNKIANRLDQRKYLLTDDGQYFRDWRGLLEYADLERDDKESILSKSEHFTTRIVILWSRKPGASVLGFVRALQKMDRYDIIQDHAESILKDCYSVQQSTISQIGINQALTLQDLESLSRNEPLTTYDAIVLFGDSDLDLKFGMHVVERLEQSGKKVFLYDRDLIIGAIEHEAAMEIVRARCKKVIALLTPTFHKNKISLFLTSYALHLQNDPDKMTRIIPVIYSSQHLESEVMKNIDMYSKLMYDTSRPYFWKRLFFSFGDINVHSDLLQMSFPMPDKFVQNLTLPEMSKVNVEPIQPTAVTPVMDPSVSRIESSASSLNESHESFSISSTTNLIFPKTPSEEPSSSSIPQSRVKVKNKIKHNILKCLNKLSN
nr:myeloid differentiation primary response protein MyD88-like [Lepeophtheirus salmonis]